jgi:hypothetical protein
MKQVCLICGDETGSLGKHIKHHDISPRDYYHKYVIKSEEVPKCETCGKELTFNNLVQPYYRNCGITCRYKSPTIRNRFSKIVTESNKTEERKEIVRKTIHYALAASDKKLYTDKDIGYIYIVEFSNIPAIKLGYSINPESRYYRYRNCGLQISNTTSFKMKVLDAIDLELKLKLEYYSERFNIKDTKYFDYQIGYSEFFNKSILNSVLNSINEWIDQHSKT